MLNRIFGRKKNNGEKGNVLLFVVIVMAIILSMIPMISTFYSNLYKQSHNYYVARENLRIGTELGGLVAQAYEYGEQLKTNSQTCTTGWNLAYGSSGHFLCFQNQNGNCVKSDMGNNICLVLTGTPVIVGQTKDHPGQVKLYAEWRPLKRNLFDFFLSRAEAAPGSDPYMPPDPTGTNTVAALTCTGAGDPIICHSCGVAQAYVCFLLQYCPSDSSGGTCGTAYTNMGVMIANNTVAANNTLTYLVTSGCPCNFVVPAYSVMTVSVWGGGGGGGTTCPSGGAGVNGTASSFAAPTPLTAGGGGGGGGSVYNVVGTPGAGGTAVNGTQNFVGTAGATTSNASGGGGGSSYTGAGGTAGPEPYIDGGAGGFPGGGGGGGGGYSYLIFGGVGGGGGGVVMKKYVTGNLVVGSTVVVTVGPGGAGGSCNSIGGTGGHGEVIVQYQ